jgi:hypothetical protein
MLFKGPCQLNGKICLLTSSLHIVPCAVCRYEVMSGELLAPHVPEVLARGDMQKLVGTYGKTWHTWQVDRGDRLPLGEAYVARFSNIAAWQRPQTLSPMLPSPLVFNRAAPAHDGIHCRWPDRPSPHIRTRRTLWR